MNKPEWQNDPSLSDIDPKKLDFLQTLVFESQTLSPKEMLKFLIDVSRRRAENGIRFTADETSRVIAVLKSRSSPEEAARIDKALRLLQRGTP